MLRRVVLALLLCAPLAAATNAPRPPPVNVSGDYHSNWDDVRLVQDGDRVIGTYVCCGGGRIEGKIYEGRVLRYRWDQPGAWGLGVWTIDGTQLRGTWGHQRDAVGGGRWDLERVTRLAQ